MWQPWEDAVAPTLSEAQFDATQKAVNSEAESAKKQPALLWHLAPELIAKEPMS